MVGNYALYLIGNFVEFLGNLLQRHEDDISSHPLNSKKGYGYGWAITLLIHEVLSLFLFLACSSLNQYL